MPSFAELREKASKAKTASVTKFQDTKDRHSSVALKNTNWNPYDKNAAPPPPPPRVNPGTRPAATQHYQPPPPPKRVGAAAPPPPAVTSAPPNPAPPGPAPPPIIRSTRPSLSPSITSSTSSESTSPPPPPPARRASALRPTPAATPELNWSALTPGDKAALFAWLDEFFSGYLGRRVGGGGA